MTHIKTATAEGIRARYLDRCDVQDELSLVSTKDLNRVCETTIDTVIHLAEAMDATLADVEDEKLDMNAFVLGAGFGAVLMIGVIVVAMMIV